MICGIGTDIVNVNRLEKGSDFLSRFVRRCLSETEQLSMQRRAITDIAANATVAR